MNRPLQISLLRLVRKLHKYTGLLLAVFLLVSAITGITLAWKKNVATLQPTTQKGISMELNTWKPIAELHDLAIIALQNHTNLQKEITVERIDARPDKGIVKVLFEQGWWEVQLDATSGKTLSVARRHADWIEQLHDGSIISDFFKLISMNILGLGLLVSVFGGVWLWYAPKILRRRD